ncbi:flavin reductase family protein [Nocardioides pantholopis]|uniref:flavin reductase family protein n=1 Tax=Nocardioides pantholopis TaxID=2483798 RepID=UPI000F08E81B|nr:flavin reductase family protein [Nocardioides pantholopis]
MTIHAGHPFPTDDDPVRRLRGRLGGAVSLWTAGEGAGRAGLTLSSVMVANGEPARLLGLVDPDSDLAEAVERTGAAVVQLLSWPDRDLAEMFAGTAPAPGGLFRQAEFEQTPWGPRLATASTWTGVRLESARPTGWSTLLTCTIEEVVVGEEAQPLEHRRGRYRRPVEDMP